MALVTSRKPNPPAGYTNQEFEDTVVEDRVPGQIPSAVQPQATNNSVGMIILSLIAAAALIWGAFYVFSDNSPSTAPVDTSPTTTIQPAPAPPVDPVVPPVADPAPAPAAPGETPPAGQTPTTTPPNGTQQ